MTKRNVLKSYNYLTGRQNEYITVLLLTDFADDMQRILIKLFELGNQAFIEIGGTKNGLEYCKRKEKRYERSGSK